MEHSIYLTTKVGNTVNHFSYEDKGLLTLYFILFLLMGSLALYMLHTFYKYWKIERKWLAPHPVSVYALWFQIIGVTLKLLHLWQYSNNGKGFFYLDIAEKVCQGVSEVIMSLLLIFLASGWKLHFEDIEFDENIEIYVPFSALTFLVQLVLVCLTFVDMDASHKYHDFAGIQGWSLVVLKISLLCFFIYCIWDSRTKSKKHDELNYLTNLSILGSAYFLAVPVSVIVTFMFEPYERQYMFTMVSQMTMFAANSALLYQLTSKRSSYR